MSSPYIDIRLPYHHSESESVLIRLQEHLEKQYLQCPITLQQALTQISSDFPKQKFAHSVALVNAFECASGMHSSYSSLQLRQRLIQLEALLDFARKITCDVPMQLGLGAKQDWYKRAADELAEPMHDMWQACFSNGDSNAATERDLICRYRLATFFQQSGWLSELTLEMTRNDWQRFDDPSHYVLTTLWEKMKTRFVELLTDSVSTTIGYSTAEPTRYEPGCSVSEVHHAQGVLSYMLCLEDKRELITDLRVIQPPLGNTLQIQRIKQDLSSITDSPNRLQLAQIYMMLINPYYPIRISCGEASDTHQDIRQNA